MVSLPFGRQPIMHNSVHAANLRFAYQVLQAKLAGLSKRFINGSRFIGFLFVFLNLVPAGGGLEILRISSAF